MALSFAEGHLCLCGEWCDCGDVPCTHCFNDDDDFDLDNYDEVR